MRLWHIDLIPYLPKSQLLAQWRELNSIYKKRDKHILINYIYDYPRHYLWVYSMCVIEELSARNIKIKNWDNYNNYFIDIYSVPSDLKFKEHNDDYLTMCYYNLKEKYIRGQKDFTKEIWDKLDRFYRIDRLYKENK